MNTETSTVRTLELEHEEHTELSYALDRWENDLKEFDAPSLYLRLKMIQNLKKKLRRMF